MAQLGFPYFNYDEVYPNKVAMDAAIAGGNWSSRIGRYLMVNYYYGADGSVGEENQEANIKADEELGAERKNWHGTIWQIIKTVNGLQLLFIGNTSVGEDLTSNKMVITTENGRITSLDELQGNSTYTSTDENGILKEEFLQPGSYLRVDEEQNIISKPVSANCILYTGPAEDAFLDKNGQYQYDSEGNLITYSKLQQKKLNSNTLLYIGSKNGTSGEPEIKEVDLRSSEYGILCSGYNNDIKQVEIIPWSENNRFLYTSSSGALKGLSYNSENGFYTFGKSNGVLSTTYNNSNGDMIYLETQDENGNALEYNKIEHKKVYDGSGEGIFDSDNWQQGLISTSSDGTSTTQYWGFKYPYYEIDNYGHVTSVIEKEVRVSNINLEETGILVEMDY